jgi:hypothetical protein
MRPFNRRTDWRLADQRSHAIKARTDSTLGASLQGTDGEDAKNGFGPLIDRTRGESERRRLCLIPSLTTPF